MRRWILAEPIVAIISQYISVKTVMLYPLNLYSQSVQSLSRVRLCDPMNRSTPGLPVHHHLPEFAQTHAHRVGDAIQPSDIHHLYNNVCQLFLNKAEKQEHKF